MRSRPATPAPVSPRSCSSTGWRGSKPSASCAAASMSSKDDCRARVSGRSPEMATADGLVQDAGWPFLVAAGRIRDYTVLVAPDFLVAAGEHGLLGVTGSAIEGGPVQVRPVRTNDGRELTLAYA